ncbi:DNA polymerase III subunit chi [Escherichia coli]
MSQVTFYLMSEQDDAQGLCESSDWPVPLRPSRGAVEPSIYLLCDDEAQALRLDELLWQLPPERFVPHQLQGEKRYGAGGDWLSAAETALCPPPSIWPGC